MLDVVNGATGVEGIRLPQKFFDEVPQGVVSYTW